MRVDDYFPFGCGDQVRERDGRHVGTVRAVVSNTVVVVWNDTGWVSYLLSGDLEHDLTRGPFLATDQYQES